MLPTDDLVVPPFPRWELDCPSAVPPLVTLGLLPCGQGLSSRLTRQWVSRGLVLSQEAGGGSGAKRALEFTLNKSLHLPAQTGSRLR